MLKLLRNKNIQTVLICVALMFLLLLIVFPWQLAVGFLIFLVFISLIFTAINALINYIAENNT